MRRRVIEVGLVIWPVTWELPGSAVLCRTLKTRNDLVRSTEEMDAEELELPLLMTAVPDWTDFNDAADAA
jgi:hypothetical protein